MLFRSYDAPQTAQLQEQNHRNFQRVKLTVTDNLGAKSSAVQTVNVRDTRPDLYIESLTWTPKKSGMPPVTLFLKRKNSIEEALDILDVMKKGAKKN